MLSIPFIPGLFCLLPMALCLGYLLLRRIPSMRWLVPVLVFAILFISMGSLCTWASDASIIGGSNLVWLDAQDERSSLTDELMLRLYLPPPLRQHCYLNDAGVCREVDSILYFRERLGWANYVAVVAVAGLFSALAAAAFYYFVWSLIVKRAAKKAESPVTSSGPDPYETGDSDGW